MYDPEMRKVTEYLETCIRNRVIYESFSEVIISPTKAEEILALLKEQEVRELTIEEWQEWKTNPKRNPICELWEHDTSPIWKLDPNTIHEPALLMGKLKLFTGKPTFEQCRRVKWE